MVCDGFDCVVYSNRRCDLGEEAIEIELDETQAGLADWAGHKREKFRETSQFRLIRTTSSTRLLAWPRFAIVGVRGMYALPCSSEDSRCET